MSEEDLESEATNEAPKTSKLDELPSWAKEEISSLRRESAGRRVTNKANEEELTKFREWQKEADKQKSDLERTLERAMSAEKDLAELRREKLQASVAEEVGLDHKLSSRIRGESKDEMLADAAELAETAGKRKGADAFLPSHGNQARQAPSTSQQFNAWVNSQ